MCIPEKCLSVMTHMFLDPPAGSRYAAMRIRLRTKPLAHENFVIQAGVEPTNNRAERAIREHVIQRKIIGTLRNCKGTAIHERLMSVMATWSQQGIDSLKMLRIKLGS